MNIPNGQRKKHHLEITSSKITFTSHHQTQTHTHTFNRKATPFSHVPGLAPRTWAVQGPMNLMGLRPSPLTVGKRAVLECPRWFAKVAPSVECVFLAPSVLSKRCCCCVESECAYFGANLLHTHTSTPSQFIHSFQFVLHGWTWTVFYGVVLVWFCVWPTNFLD